LRSRAGGSRVPLVNAAPDRIPTCPACGREVSEDDLMCECEHILSVDVLRHSPPADRIPNEDAAKFADTDPSATFRFNPVDELKGVVSDELRLFPRSDTDIFREDLSALELYCYARIHQSRSWAEVCTLTGLGRIESCVIVLGLLNKGIVATAPRDAPVEESSGPSWEEQDAAHEHAKAHFGLASSALDDGNPTGAAWHLRKAIAFFPKLEYAEALERVLDTAGRHCGRYYSMVRSHLSSRQPQRALEALDVALGDFPAEAGFHNLRAVAIMANLGDIDNAIASVRRAVRIDPFNEAFQVNLDQLTDRSHAGRANDG